MLDSQSWLPEAQKLAQGQRRRVSHGCGPGTTLLVNAGNDGWSAWCFRCNEPGFVPYPQPSLAERIAKLNAVQAAEAEVESDPRPPMPANFDPRTWPLEARVWLYKAGFSNDRIQECGYYYCERLARVVLPVVEAGTVTYWQARGFDASRPKYLNPSVDKPLAKYGSGSLLVLTEDILSAGRVGEVTEAWSILGTSLDDAKARAIADADRPVALWLDPDAAGRRGMAKARTKLGLLGVQARVIHSERDPKLYSKEEITQFLWT